MTQAGYPSYYYRLQGLIASMSDRLPEQTAAFTRLHESATSDGVLSRRTKELIALCVAMTTARGFR